MNSKSTADHDKLNIIIAFLKAFYPKQYRDSMGCMTQLERGLFAREWKKVSSPYDLSTIEESLRRAVLKHPYMPSLSLFAALCREVAKQKKEKDEDILLCAKKMNKYINNQNRSKDTVKISIIAENALSRMRKILGAKKIY